MTLRTWIFLLVVGLYFVITTNANASPAEPSVWEQMQFSPHKTAKAVVKGIEATRDGVLIEVASPGQSEITKLKLCTDENQVPFASGRETEPVRAVYVQERLNLLRDALKTGDPVELGFSGPWSPCLNSVRATSKGA